MWGSPFAPLLLLDWVRPALATRDGVRFGIVERTTFGILDAAFAPNALCLTESGGPVRCLELTGTQRWRHDPPRGTHVLDVDYTARDGAFVGIEWRYETGGPMRLVRFDELNGARDAIAEFPPEPAASFVLEATTLVTSSAALIDTSSGGIHRRAALSTAHESTRGENAAHDWRCRRLPGSAQLEATTTHPSA